MLKSLFCQAQDTCWYRSLVQILMKISKLIRNSSVKLIHSQPTLKMNSDTIKSTNGKTKSTSSRSRVVDRFLEVYCFVKRLYYLTRSVLRIIFRHPVTGTSIIPIFADGRIVLARRHDTGRWALPGGMVEWGEEIATTVRRELLEETGLELVRISRLVGVYSNPDRDSRVHSICVVVEAEVRGKIQIQDEQEISEVEAFNPSDLPLVGLSYDNDQQLKNYLDGLTVLA